MHEEDQEDSYPCHQSKSSCHFSLLKMNTISNDYFRNSSLYDSSYNEETFYCYSHLLDGEYSYQECNDTRSILLTSHIFNSSQVNNQMQFDLFENFQFNQPIYDNFYDNIFEKMFLRRKLFKNKIWILIILMLILFQIIYFIA